MLHARALPTMTGPTLQAQQFNIESTHAAALCFSMCIYIYIYECVCICMYVCMYVCMYMYICMYVCMYVCMYMYVCICIYVPELMCVVVLVVFVHALDYLCIYAAVYVSSDTLRTCMYTVLHIMQRLFGFPRQELHSSMSRRPSPTGRKPRL